MTGLELRGVAKTFRGGIVAARSVDLSVGPGELFVVVGPSGSGKSTLLRLVAGLETLDGGSIHRDGRRIDGLAPRDRDLALVFQEPVVYPHLDVAGNIAFGLRARRVDRAEVRSRVAEAAEILGLGDLLGRDPATLSGGQRRRVALGRALALRPSLYLFDEPYSGLDAPLRATIRAEIAELHRRLDATMVLVTHDQAEALALADRLAVVDAGRVVQVGRPLDIYDAPRTAFVARFLGTPPMALLSCLMHDDHPDPETVRVEPRGVAPPEPPWSVPRGSLPVGVPLDLGIRADRVTLAEHDAPPRPGWGGLAATVDRLEPTGDATIVTLRAGPHRFAARTGPRPALRVGAAVAVRIHLDGATWFDPITGERIG